jgi:hypothetical protein
MGSRVSAFIFILNILIALPPSIFAFETQDTDYRQTVLYAENFSDHNFTSTIRKEIQHNDHTARVLLDAKHKNLLIIHHKSIGINEMKTIFANLGISTKAVAQHNYQPALKSTLSNSNHNAVRPIKNCGATKTAWKRLFLKYFH